MRRRRSTSGAISSPTAYGEHGLPYDSAYGDGTRFTADEIAHIDAAYDAATCRESYRVGDLLLVDNILSSHGREPYSGDRKILVALGEPREVTDCAPTVPAAPGPLPA